MGPDAVGAAAVKDTASRTVTSCWYILVEQRNMFHKWANKSEINWTKTETVANEAKK